MSEREQIRRVCQWNRELARENGELHRALGESQTVAARASIERDSALIFLDSAWQAAAEGQRR